MSSGPSNPSRGDPRVHARFLSYRERHVYFGRGEEGRQLTFAEFSALDAELAALLATTGEARASARERIAELKHQLHLD
jgi:hypothetical protein